MSKKPRKTDAPPTEQERDKAGETPGVPLEEALQKLSDTEREALRRNLIINPRTKGERS